MEPVSNHPEAAGIAPGQAEQATLAWARERLANSERIAAMKTGEDREGWLEDVAHWREIVRQLCGAQDAERRYQAESLIVDEVWAALGISTYEQAGGKHIAEIVRAEVAARVQAEQKFDKLNELRIQEVERAIRAEAKVEALEAARVQLEQELAELKAKFAAPEPQP